MPAAPHSSPPPRPVTGAFAGCVLAGGASRRMGVDKALMTLAGSPMIAYPIGVLRDAGAATVIAVGGGSAERQRRLGALGVVVVNDARPGGGPVPAIGAALRLASQGGHRFAVVLACDMPHVDREVIARLVETASARTTTAGSSTAAIAQTPDGRWQPLLGAYPTDWADAFTRASTRGGRLQGAPSVRDALNGQQVVLVPVSSAVARNINTRDDLAAAERELLRPRSIWPAGGGR